MIDIHRAGLLTTVQDLGRTGMRAFGVAGGGAVDPLACAVANRLVGNPLNAATLEITMGACVLRFTSATLVSLTGADCHADLGGTPVWSWWRFPVSRGQTLTLRPSRVGMRTYLAVAGGIDVPETLGSRSTDLAAGFGGFAGRALRDGDRIAIAHPGAAARHAAPLGVRPPLWLSDPLVQRVRVLPGPEYDDFTAAAQKHFWENPWQVTPNSNRMGYRLSGPEPLARKKNRSQDLLSHGVLPGVIQVPPSGQPIILLAEEGEEERIIRGLELGINDYLIRPVDQQELTARLRTQVRRKRYNDQLRASVTQTIEMAVTDGLTGLHNRRYLDSHLQTLFDRAVARRRPLSVMITDLDRFKVINDTHGHDGGDQVLREFARRLRKNVRGIDLACRYGGEEFVVVMPDTEGAVAEKVAERVRAEIASQPFVIGTQTVEVTVSVGVSCVLKGLDSVAALMKRADLALYEAKSGGRNRVVAKAA